MQSFYLIDGSMIFQALSRLQSFNAPQPNWFRPLSAHLHMGLAAPLLIAAAGPPQGGDSPGGTLRLAQGERINNEQAASSPALAQSPEQVRDIARARRAFPRQLHCSVLQSEYSLEALANHLSQFVIFNDCTGDRYGLRFADCRVLAYLPQILTAGQWRALSAPIAQWHIATRDGQGMFLQLGQPSPPARLPKPFALSAEQIEQLMNAGEADSLLANLRLNPENLADHQIQTHYDSAVQCIHIWQNHANSHPERSDRRVLRSLAKRVFQSNAVWLNDENRIQQELKNITSDLLWN